MSPFIPLTMPSKGFLISNFIVLSCATCVAFVCNQTASKPTACPTTVNVKSAIPRMATNKKPPQQSSKDQTARLSNLLDKADSYYDDELYSQAEPLYQEALKIEQSLEPREPYYEAETLNSLAANEQSAGQYNLCETKYLQAIKIIENLESDDSFNLTTYLLNLGNLYETTGDYAKAEATYERALPIAEAAVMMHGRLQNVDTAMARDELRTLAEIVDGIGTIYLEQGDCADASPYLQRALRLRQSSIPHDDWKVAESYASLGSMYSTEGHFDRATQSFKKAIAIHGRSDQWNLALATDLNGLGGCYFCTKKCKAAATVFQKALQIRKTLLGGNHFHVALSEANLATVCARQHKTKQAARLFEQSINIIDKCFGPYPKSYNIAQVFNDYADFLEHSKRKIESEQFRERAREAERNSCAAGVVHGDSFSTSGTASTKR